VPVKRKKSLDPRRVREIAESILDIGQQLPILVRSDNDRFVLVEGLHRLEACKALGEGTIVGLIVSARPGTRAQHLLSDDVATAEREKKERLRRLRLEKEAKENSSVSARKELTAPERLKSPSKARAKRAQDRPKTLADWIDAQERDGSRY
jgi:ParB/Sulfiredoxin domain